MSIYDIPVTMIDGTNETMARWKGKTLLIVNVASKCGLTPQYEGLEKLHRDYAARGFSVLGFPCNQFSEQEPGTEEEIQTFCSVTYDVTFPLFAKIDVNGNDAHPLYKHLKGDKPGILGTEAIKWNFTKFLVDGSGTVVKRYAPTDAPDGIGRDIEALLV